MNRSDFISQTSLGQWDTANVHSNTDHPLTMTLEYWRVIDGSNLRLLGNDCC
jgi:hypothetical protein